MNNEQHPLDDLFKQRLEQAAAPVPDDMWARIARVRQQQRRRVIAWWSIATVAAVLAVGSMFVFWPAPNTGNATTTAPAEKVVPSRNAPTTATVTPSITADAAPTKAPTPTSSAHTPSVSTTTTNEHYTIQLAPTVPASSAIAIASAPTLPSFEAATSTTFTDIPVEATDAPTAEIVAEIASPQAPQITTTNEAAAVPTTNDLLRVSGPHQRERLQVVAQLPVRNFFQADPIDIKSLANHTSRCAKFDAPAFHWDVELLAGPAYAQSLLEAKATEGQTHLKRRQDTETPGLSYSTGVRIGITSKTGIGLKTGLQYSQINDRFTYYIGRRMDVSVIFGPNGEIIGRDTTYTEGRNETSTNHLQFVEVPLLLGFEQQVGQFRVGINAGAFLNLHFNASGYIYSPVGEEPVAFGQEGDRNVLPIFRQDASASWYTGLSVAYNLRGRCSLMAEPYFRAFPRALSSTGYTISQRYWMAGLQMGLRVRL